MVSVQFFVDDVTVNRPLPSLTARGSAGSAGNDRLLLLTEVSARLRPSGHARSACDANEAQSLE